MSMEYGRYWNRFKIEDFIKRVEPLGLWETTNACTMERRELDKISISKSIPFSDIFLRQDISDVLQSNPGQFRQYDQFGTTHHQSFIIF